MQNYENIKKKNHKGNLHNLGFGDVNAKLQKTRIPIAGE